MIVNKGASETVKRQHLFKIVSTDKLYKLKNTVRALCMIFSGSFKSGCQ